MKIVMKMIMLFTYSVDIDKTFKIAHPTLKIILKFNLRSVANFLIHIRFTKGGRGTTNLSCEGVQSTCWVWRHPPPQEILQKMLKYCNLETFPHTNSYKYFVYILPFRLGI